MEENNLPENEKPLEDEELENYRKDVIKFKNQIEEMEAFGNHFLKMRNSLKDLSDMLIGLKDITESSLSNVKTVIDYRNKLEQVGNNINEIHPISEQIAAEEDEFGKRLLDLKSAKINKELKTLREQGPEIQEKSQAIQNSETQIHQSIYQILEKMKEVTFDELNISENKNSEI